MFTWVNHPPIIRDKRNTPIRLEGEDTGATKDVVKDPRKQFHARTASFTGKGVKPIVPVLPLAENEDPYVAPQNIQSAYFSQLFSAYHFKKLAKGWITHVTHKPGEMTLKEACYHNKQVSIEAGIEILAICWDDLAKAINCAEKKAEDGPEKLYIKKPWTVSISKLCEKQRKKDERARRREAREKALEKQRAEAPAVTLKSPSIAPSGAYPGSNHSSKTTPMVTAVTNTPHQNAVHGKKHGHIEDQFLLPPAAFGTSLSSSTASTDGEDSDGGITMPALPRTVSWSDVRRMNRSRPSSIHNEPSGYEDPSDSKPSDYTSSGLSVIKESISPSTTSAAIPIASNSRVTALAGNSRHGTPSNHGPSSVRDARNMSLGLYSERTSSSAEGPLLGESYDDKYDRFASKSRTGTINETDWLKRDELDADDDVTTDDEDENYKAFYEYTFDDDDLVPHTTDAEYIVREFIESFTDVGEVQFVATLMLLTYDLIDLDESTCDDMISLYIGKSF